MREVLDGYFGISRSGSTFGTEVRAGIVTFLTMAYILFVNPQILSEAGMPATDVAAATALAAACACLVMGLVARYPFALAPGMGLNAYFTYGVVHGLGVSWQLALTAVFVEGLLFLALAVTGARTALMNAVPRAIRIAAMAGIGLFLATIGLSGAGIVVDDPATLVALGDVSQPEVWLALAGLVLMTALLASGFRGALLVGIAAVTIASWLGGWAPAPEALLSWPRLPTETFAAFDWSHLLTGKLALVVLAFLFVDIFDTAGTLLGLGRLGGFLDSAGELPRANRAFAADATGTAVGALFGTSTVTSYVESASGIEEGGRTGLTAVVVGLAFLASMFATPLATAVPVAATAPALILVGAMMMRGTNAIDWDRYDEAIPAFITMIVMPLTYSIANGICFGIVTYVVLKILRGRFGELRPMLVLLALAIAAYYGLRA